MRFDRKLDLIRLILNGEENEASRQGFCDRERSIIRTDLLMKGYLEETAPLDDTERLAQEERGSRYRMTESGREFMGRIGKR